MISKKKLFFPLFITVFIAALTGCRESYAENNSSGGDAEVDFIGELPTPGEFTLFANGGWTGNWYVGSDQGWVTELSVPEKEYDTLYIGARLGRSKTSDQIREAVNIQRQSAAAQKIIDILQEDLSAGELTKSRDLLQKGISGQSREEVSLFLEDKVSRGKIIETESIISRVLSEAKDVTGGPYKIMIGISQSKEARPEGEALVLNSAIPREGSSTRALEDISDSRWFWIEADKNKIPDSEPIYIHLWTEAKELNSIETAPILAAGIGSNEGENTYIVTEDEYRTIKFFEPAIALKGVSGDHGNISITIKEVSRHPVSKQSYLIRIEAEGKDITGTWLEVKRTGGSWHKAGRYIDKPPYHQTLGPAQLSSGRYSLRAAVQNWAGQKEYSKIKEIKID
ncbi:MAG: hypothetical protein U9R36_02650 [Elusimicrobiota bacterium]|nr:hypothetical protein [Elusimicrobiota bacterium]